MARASRVSEAVDRPGVIAQLSAARRSFPRPERANGSRDLDWTKMKAGIHPEYQLAHVHCSCGNSFYTRSTESDLHVELCSECHPFYTGKQKLVDTGGRVERFQRRAAKHAKAGK
jgi:large subunit ribosomal protein L31